MQPLLRIQTLPIEITYTTTQARLIQTTKQPRAEVTRIKGRADIQTTPVKVNVDSFETRASAGLKSPRRSIEEFAQTGRSDAVAAAQDYAALGSEIIDSHGKGNPIVEHTMSKILSTHETIMTFIPSVRPEITTEGGTISFDYSPDKLQYEWLVSTRPELEYQPGSIEFNVTQYNQVIIEYIGSPMYVPPSADPNYIPLDKET